MPPIGKVDLPAHHEIEPVRAHFADSGPSGTLEIDVYRPRRVWRDESLGGRNDAALQTVLPLVVVNGRAVDLGEGRTAIAVPAGRVLVEAMDDHRYTSRTVEIAEGGSVQLWVGTGQLRHNNRIMIGPKGYVAWATATPSIPKIRAGLVGILIATVLLVVLGPLALAVAPALTALVVPLAILGGVIPYRKLRRHFEHRSTADLDDPSTFPAPEVVAAGSSPDRPVCLVGSKMELPSTAPTVVLRFAPDPRALDQIAVMVASTTGSAPLRTYISNSFEDWLAAPEVSVNGTALPPRWGTLWIPVEPGRVSIDVRLPGFSDPRRRDSGAVIPSEARIELDVSDGVQHVDCLFNIVRLAADRLSAASGTESAWQQVLRKHNRLEIAERDATAPPLRLEPTSAGPVP